MAWLWVHALFFCESQNTHLRALPSHPPCLPPSIPPTHLKVVKAQFKIFGAGVEIDVYMRNIVEGGNHGTRHVAAALRRARQRHTRHSGVSIII